MKTKRDISFEMEEEFEWDKWRREIPYIQFKSDWEVKVIPPFGGAVVRFGIRKEKANVSVYLDCYNLIGIYDGPYWEIYPDTDGDCFRCEMNDTESLIRQIEKSLSRQIES